jgi:hypothetical protein
MTAIEAPTRAKIGGSSRDDLSMDKLAPDMTGAPPLVLRMSGGTDIQDRRALDWPGWGSRLGDPYIRISLQGDAGYKYEIMALAPMNGLMPGQMAGDLLPGGRWDFNAGQPWKGCSSGKIWPETDVLSRIPESNSCRYGGASDHAALPRFRVSIAASETIDPGTIPVSKPEIEDAASGFAAAQGLTDGMTWLRDRLPRFFKTSRIEICLLRGDGDDEETLGVRIFASLSWREFRERAHVLCRELVAAGHVRLYERLSIFQKEA